MANLASVMRDEIEKIVEKKIKSQLGDAQKGEKEQQKTIRDLEKRIESLEKNGKGGGTTGRGGRRKKGSKKKSSKKKTSAKKKDGRSLRFSPKGLKTHREKLGLSASDYAKLVGVSPLSIYNWEGGKTRPRDSAIEQLSAVRGMGKREAQRALEGGGDASTDTDSGSES